MFLPVEYLGLWCSDNNNCIGDCLCVCMYVCGGGGGVSFIFVRLSFTSPCHKLDVLLSSWRGNDFATNLPLHSGTIFAIVLQPSFKANTSTLNREHFQSVDDVI